MARYVVPSRVDFVVFDVSGCIETPDHVDFV